MNCFSFFKPSGLLLVAWATGLLFASNAEAADWPQWGCDAGRGGVTSEELAARLHLEWVRQLPVPRPAWPESQPALRFDVSYSPVAAGIQLFVPSMVNDSVTAYDLRTGQQQWRFYAEGPVRLAPIADSGRVYFGSDDGYLYCLNAADGKLLWRFRGGPADRRVLGNERLVSTWPVRGGPVLLNGRIYFTAGIWPFMGIFVHAIDAESGKPIWVNSGEGATYAVQPHNSPAFGGFVPRGHLAATPFGLVAPGGRTQPGCYDLETGRLCWFSFGAKNGGTHHVTARGPWFFAGSAVRQFGDGKDVKVTPAILHDEQTLYGISGKDLVAERVPAKGERPQRLWNARLPESLGTLHVKAGKRLFFGRSGAVTAVEVRPNESLAEVVWTGEIQGEPWTMLAAQGRLVVVTEQGAIYAFGAAAIASPPKTYRESDALPAGKASLETAEAEGTFRAAIAQMQAQSGVSEGYAAVFGVQQEWIDAIERATRLSQIVVDPDAAAIDSLRRRADEAGLYGRRLSAHVGDMEDFKLPPYFASLAFVEQFSTEDRTQAIDRLRRVFEVLRPYGGTARLPVESSLLESLVKEAALAGAQVKAADGLHSLLIRAGELPGAADWTHQYADAGNSVVSQDHRVKAPLGLLWFGGPSNDAVLPRHGHGPAPQVAAGRLVIEGRHMLRALDIYSGRLLWQTELPDLGLFYDNTSHQPGANEIGSNYVTLPDAVYVVHRKKVLRLDPQTGQPFPGFRLHGSEDEPDLDRGFLAASGDLLAVTSSPMKVAAAETSSQGGFFSATPFSSTSRRLAVYDRHTGQRLWQREARYGLRHNTIVLGGGRLFAIDGLSQAQQDAMKRRGVNPEEYVPQLLALDARTGREHWTTSREVFGTFLGYSAEYDVVLQAGSAARDRAKDETGKGMAVYRAADGRVLWKDLALSHNGPCMLHGDAIIAQDRAYSLLTGERKTRPHPLTGEPIPWQYARNYGCNTATACQNLLLFRSAAAGYYDLASDGGTANLGGFKSGCTSNLIAAGGVLTAPEYTRTCTCPYQNQTSLALVHDPAAETWSFNKLAGGGEPIRRVGVNFGAPGDRMADDGTLWLDWPSVGGPSPDPKIECEPKQPPAFRLHSSAICVPNGTAGLAWVAASGIEGVQRVSLTLSEKPLSPPRRYRVRLHFAEPGETQPGERVFDVRVQEKLAIEGLDVVRAAGAARTALVKEVSGVEVADKLEITLAPGKASAGARAILSGIEVTAEGW